MDRYLIIGYTAKGGSKEYASIKGYKLDRGQSVPSHDKIRSDCLKWVNNEGDNFNFFRINFMQFVDEADYKSFFGDNK